MSQISNTYSWNNSLEFGGTSPRLTNQLDTTSNLNSTAQFSRAHNPSLSKEISKFEQKIDEIYSHTFLNTEGKRKKIILAIEDLTFSIHLKYKYYKTICFGKIFAFFSSRFGAIAKAKSVINRTIKQMSPLSSKHIPDLKTYLLLLGPNHLPLEETENRVKQGRELIHALYRGETPAKTLREKREAFGDIVWYLTFLSIKKGQAFDRGAFVIEDPDYKVANYFEEATYERPSSHLRERGLSCQGMNIRDLPTGHRTALLIKFETIEEKPLLFIKPERWGFGSHSNKIKGMLQSLQHRINHTYHFFDYYLHRLLLKSKAKIGKPEYSIELKKAFKKFIYENNEIKQPEDINNYLIFGFSGLYLLLQNNPKFLTIDYQNKSLKKIQDIAIKYNLCRKQTNKQLELINSPLNKIRTGNEVIFTKKDFLNDSLYFRKN